jgi:hypothetical protein
MKVLMERIARVLAKVGKRMKVGKMMRKTTLKKKTKKKTI